MIKLNYTMKKQHDKFRRKTFYKTKIRIMKKEVSQKKLF